MSNSKQLITKMRNIQQVNFIFHRFIALCLTVFLMPISYVKATDSQQLIGRNAIANQQATQTMAMHSETLRQLMLALYQANPKHLKKSTQVSAEEMVQWTFEGPFGWKFDGVRRLQGSEALMLAVDADFPGDRVLALIAGLHTMLAKTYGAKNEYDFSGEIIPQNMYNAARNIEIASAKFNQLAPNQLLLTENGKPVELTQQLRTLISRVDADAQAFAAQKKQTIQSLPKDVAQPLSWQSL